MFEVIKAHVELITAMVAVVGSAIAVLWKLPDRRRELQKEQHQVLQGILADPNNKHDLELETAFRLCFNAAAPASVVRFLLLNRFPLREIERYCSVREYLTWSDESKTFSFKRKRHRLRWLRGLIVGGYLAVYVALAGLLVALVDATARAPDPNPAAVLLVGVSLVALAFLCLWQASLLRGAAHFIKHLPDYSKPRSPIAAQQASAVARAPAARSRLVSAFVTGACAAILLRATTFVDRRRGAVDGEIEQPRPERDR